MNQPPAVRRVVVVGASLAGLSTAREVRRLGFDGQLTVIGDEPYPPYDRPPLTKGALTGRLAPDRTELPVDADLDVTWVLGVEAVALGRGAREVLLDDGRRAPYDRVVVSTGLRARPWPRPDERRLQGLVTVRTRDDATDLAARLAARPRRVLVVGAGFIGSEVASSCRELGLDVTVVDRAETPLQAALGHALGVAAAGLLREHGVDLGTSTSVTRIQDDGSGHVGAATLDDGTTLEVDLVVVAVGSVPATGWLAGSGIALTPQGSVTCDDSLRVRTGDAAHDPACYAAGDVAAVPHPTYDGALLAVEHWGTAVEHGRTAAHNLLHAPSEHRRVTALPRFWSNQFGLNIKSVGVTSTADQVVVAQGSLRERRGVLLYGRAGVTVAAVALDAPRELEPYAPLVARRAPFPPALEIADPGAREPTPVRFAGPADSSHETDAEVVSAPPAASRRARPPHRHRAPPTREVHQMAPHSSATSFAEILEPEHRAAPQHVWARLRATPVSRQDDGTWVVTGYDAVRALMGDPRISSDRTKAGPDATVHAPAAVEGQFTGFIDLDPPDRTRARRAVMRHFGPPVRPRTVLDLEPEITRLTTDLLDRAAQRTEMDVVEDFAYPLPVAVITQLLGIPASDVATVRHWFEVIVDEDLQRPDATPEQLQEFGDAVGQSLGYMADLARRRRSDPGPDLISGLANDTTDGQPMSERDIASTGLLLLGAGHETTVNSVSSAILILLRDPDRPDLLRSRPELVPGAFEEVLRLEPPITFRDRLTLDEITVGDVTIPRGVTVQLSLAAANRDPARFTDPDRFDPQRPDNQHLSFLGGPHYCFGAPLARLEGRIMLTEWLRRVDRPRLLADPPPYRASAALRGPRHLPVAYERILP